ncbi:VOC family protein [Undibacterium sp.]|uniref:VOC family protein n=1 Tax=Undibacterium sp. TaxID=1914977 RepID=UPI002BB4EA00|nr:VOC family protein [Undibacterium sp.]HTD05833.1 VOC family protein [Undibacterium sp.]
MSPKKTPLTTHSAYAESALPAPIQRLERVAALVQAKSLAFLMFEKPDLEAVEDFLTDFGMHTVSLTKDRLVMRGSGSAPCIYVAHRGPRARYLGAAFTVSNEEDLLVLQSQAGARLLPPEVIPGGGIGVELVDPAGNLLWLVTGTKQVDPFPVRAPLHPLTNGPSMVRRVNTTVRAPLEPAAVVRLGHVVLQTIDFPSMARWYMRHLGVIPSDVQYLADGSPNLCFFRLNLGSTPADHHSLVLVGGLEEKYEHSAYEVVDLDALGQGNNVLRANGHRHMWGIGRHILGSQLFDYWFDPDGMEFEHYTDGDLFTADYEPHYSPLNLSGIWAWGDDVPKSMGPQHNLSTLIKIFRLLCSRRLSMNRLRLLGSALSAPPRPWL